MPPLEEIESVESRAPGALWWIAGLFSVLVLAGHTLLDERFFAALLIAVGLIDVFVAATRRPALSRTLLLSQSVVGVATVAAVLLYVVRFVGLGPVVPRVLLDFLRGSLVNARTYLHLLGYSLLFLALAAVVLLAVFALLGRWLDRPRFIAALYAASAVNLACDYALRRPLFQVSGEPDALGFFFASGVFGLENSLPLHLLLLAVCVVAWRRGGDEA